MNTTQTQFKIYRDGTLDRWRTYSPRILPAIVETLEHTQTAYNAAIEASPRVIQAFKDHMYKVANS